uniref:Uncharacterized protein n=1 Tax=Mustela putorius furo TaxID=9669 RepID=M3YTV6_MUSPF
SLKGPAASSFLLFGNDYWLLFLFGYWLLVAVTCVYVRKSLAIIRTICFFITSFFFSFFFFFFFNGK